MNQEMKNKLSSGIWQQHWASWKAGGLSQAEYARQRQVNLHRFRYWINKFRRPENQAGSTALVKLPAQTLRPSESALELVVDKKYRLMIRPGFDPSLLQAVLSTLDGRS